MNDGYLLPALWFFGICLGLHVILSGGLAGLVSVAGVLVVLLAAAGIFDALHKRKIV